MSADVVVTWVVNIGSGVSWSSCFFVHARDSGVTGGGEGKISPGDAVGGGGFDSWRGGEWPDWSSVLCFPFRVTTGAMIGARLDSVVELWSSSCVGVLSISLSMLRMLSKASHDKPSCSQSGEILGAFGSTPVARRHDTTARIISPGVESTRRVVMAPRLSVGRKT